MRRFETIIKESSRLDNEFLMEIDNMDNIEEAESEDNDHEYFYYDKRLPCVNHLLNNNIKNSMKMSNHVKDVLNEVK